MKQRIEDAITRIKQGHRDGLADLYNLSHRAIFAFILPLIADYQLAEDIMQETYVKAYRAIDSYRDGTNGLNWMFTIAKNIALTNLGKRSREELRDYDNQREPSGATTDSYDIDSPTIDLARKILDEQEQSILFLHTIGEYKHREIAEILEIPLGTVTWKYQEAIKKMKHELKGGSNR
jgi:RNA polymerase sigma-70 factor (ECF subfamily)